ncbi:MAG: nucleoid-associated protein [Bacteroidetes bacterium]|nr:nucleoid-associated protein [Bacteroidota bacterium]MDA1118885.1 nucleoid-associated protein [Bacteroidota bacterium]
MYNFSQTKIDQISIHEVGNADNGIVNISAQPTLLPEPIRELLTKYFLKPFKEGMSYHFDIDNSNPVREQAIKIFENKEHLHESSEILAKELLSSSQSPNIKTGEFFVVYFSNCQVENEVVDALGIFKSENKDTYLKVFPENHGFGINVERGININKLDKGAIIYNKDQDDGFLVQVVAQTNQNEARYWNDQFLNVRPREDNYHHTHQYMQMCRDFVMEEMTTENRGEQLGMMSEAVNFFKENDHFDRVEFQEQVIRQPEIIEAFEGYSKKYELDNHLSSIDDFEISPQAVRFNKRFTRSVIKLDKNFHIYVHGSRERIVKGFDENRNMHFYQVFFEDES